MQRQPNFTIKDNAVRDPDYDNLSDEQLQQLINESIRLKTGRAGQHRIAPPPPQKRHVDLDALLRKQ